jgi:hypothetical protein
MSLFSSLRDSSGPSVAVEIASNRVSAASLGWRGGEAVVAAHASAPHPPGAPRSPPLSIWCSSVSAGRVASA